MSKNLRRAYSALVAMEDIAYQNLPLYRYDAFLEQYSKAVEALGKLDKKSKRKKLTAAGLVDEVYWQAGINTLYGPGTK